MSKKHRRFSPERLLAARTAAKMSRQELSRAIDDMVGPESIWRYEHGALPKIDVLLRIAEALDVQPAELTDAEG